MRRVRPGRGLIDRLGGGLTFISGAVGTGVAVGISLWFLRIVKPFVDSLLGHEASGHLLCFFLSLSVRTVHVRFLHIRKYLRDGEVLVLHFAQLPRRGHRCWGHQIQGWAHPFVLGRLLATEIGGQLYCCVLQGALGIALGMTLLLLLAL